MLNDSQPSLKKRISEGENLLGRSVAPRIDRSELTSTLEKGPYDFVWIDSQHRPLNEPAVSTLCGMAAELGVDVLFRIRHTQHTYLIGNFLDIGPSGIEVPQVESEATVDEAIDYFYYPPVGKRSWGGIYRRGIDERSDRLEYTAWWQQYGVLWMQVESVEGVTNVRKLAKKGVDCISFGPNDLSYSMESHPDSPFKTVDDCVRHVVEQLQGTGVAVCFRIRSPEKRQQYRDMGVTVLMEY